MMQQPSSQSRINHHQCHCSCRRCRRRSQCPCRRCVRRHRARRASPQPSASPALAATESHLRDGPVLQQSRVLQGKAPSSSTSVGRPCGWDLPSGSTPFEESGLCALAQVTCLSWCAPLSERGEGSTRGARDSGRLWPRRWHGVAVGERRWWVVLAAPQGRKSGARGRGPCAMRRGFVSRLCVSVCETVSATV